MSPKLLWHGPSHQQWHMFLSDMNCMGQTWSGGCPKAENGNVSTPMMYFFLQPLHNRVFQFQNAAETRTNRYPGANRHEAFLHLGNANRECTHPLLWTHAQALNRALWLHVKNQPSERDLLICSQTLWVTSTGNLTPPPGLLRLKQLKLSCMGPEYSEIIPNDLISLERRKRSTTHTHWRQDVQVCMVHLLQFTHLTGYRLLSLSPGSALNISVKGFKPHLQPSKGYFTLSFRMLPKTLSTQETIRFSTSTYSHSPQT